MASPSCAPRLSTLLVCMGTMMFANMFDVSRSIHNSYHVESWEHISAIKSSILRMWDNAVTPVKICCIKFVQRVVLAQTASNGMEQKVGAYIDNISFFHEKIG